jgi:hypothetical protein
MPTTNQMIAGVAALGFGGAYLWMKSKEKQNPVHNIGDRWEQTKAKAQKAAGDDALSTAAKEAYYDTKQRAGEASSRNR